MLQVEKSQWYYAERDFEYWINWARSFQGLQIDSWGVQVRLVDLHLYAGVTIT